MAILLESGKMSWVTSTIEVSWLRSDPFNYPTARSLVSPFFQLLKDVAAARQEIVLSTDGIPDEDDDEARGPSNDALQKITAHSQSRSWTYNQSDKAKSLPVLYTLCVVVITDDEERRLAMSMNPHLKLLLRLVDCELTSDESQWQFFSP